MHQYLPAGVRDCLTFVRASVKKLWKWPVNKLVLGSCSEHILASWALVTNIRGMRKALLWTEGSSSPMPAICRHGPEASQKKETPYEWKGCPWVQQAWAGRSALLCAPGRVTCPLHQEGSSTGLLGLPCQLSPEQPVPFPLLLPRPVPFLLHEAAPFIVCMKCTLREGRFFTFFTFRIILSAFGYINNIL